jgi:hypothetical protein
VGPAVGDPKWLPVYVTTLTTCAVHAVAALGTAFPTVPIAQALLSSSTTIDNGGPQMAFLFTLAGQMPEKEARYVNEVVQGWNTNTVKRSLLALAHDQTFGPDDEIRFVAQRIPHFGRLQHLNVLCYLCMWFFVAKVIINFFWKLTTAHGRKREAHNIHITQREVFCNSRFAQVYTFATFALYVSQFCLMYYVAQLCWKDRSFLTSCTWYVLGMTFIDTFSNFVLDVLKLARIRPRDAPLSKRDFYIAVAELCNYGLEWSPMLCVVFLCMELSEEPHSIPHYINNSMEAIVTSMLLLAASPLFLIPLMSSEEVDHHVTLLVPNTTCAKLVHAFRWALMIIIMAEVAVMIKLIYQLPRHLPFLGFTICGYFMEQLVRRGWRSLQLCRTPDLHMSFQARGIFGATEVVGRILLMTSVYSLTYWLFAPGTGLSLSAA